MWSLGTVVYLLLYGFPPFNHRDQNEIYKLIKIGNYA